MLLCLKHIFLMSAWVFFVVVKGQMNVESKMMSVFCLKACVAGFTGAFLNPQLSSWIQKSLLFQRDDKGKAWLLCKIPLPMCSSLCHEVTSDMIYPTHEFQSKQQLATFSSLRCTVNSLRKTCNSLHRNPVDIPTYCFSDTLFRRFGAVMLQWKAGKKSAPKPHRTLHLDPAKTVYYKIMALREEYLCANLHPILQSHFIMEVAAAKELSVL